MAALSLPRVETIEVPDDIPANDIGKFVTSRAHSILTDIGLGALIPRTSRLKAITTELWELSFEVLETYAYQPRVDIQRPNQGERKGLEEDKVAVRDTGSVKQTSRVGGFFR